MSLHRKRPRISCTTPLQTLRRAETQATFQWSEYSKCGPFFGLQMVNRHAWWFDASRHVIKICIIEHKNTICVLYTEHRTVRLPGVSLLQHHQASSPAGWSPQPTHRHHHHLPLDMQTRTLPRIVSSSRIQALRWVLPLPTPSCPLQCQRWQTVMRPTLQCKELRMMGMINGYP